MTHEHRVKNHEPPVLLFILSQKCSKDHLNDHQHRWKKKRGIRQKEDSSSSSPAQRVSGHDRCADACFARTAGSSATTGRVSSTALSVTASARHEVTSHASAAALAHLWLVLCGWNARGTSVALELSLATVTLSDVNHGGSIDGCTCYSSHADTNRAALDRR